jgi:cell division protein FtsA
LILGQKQNYIVGLDIGSDKTCALVCRQAESGKLEVLGLGTAESKGWRRGVIVHIDGARNSVKKAVEEAEAAAGVPIDFAYVGVCGPHVKGVNSTAAISLGSRRREVTPEDVARLRQAAREIALPPDRELLNEEPQQYLVDAQDGIRQPVGMVGSRLQVSVHLVTASSTHYQNVVTTVNHVGIRLPDNGLIFEPLAAAQGILTADERDQGVALIDLGAGCTGMVVYREGVVQHTAVIPVGGEHFTNDISVGLRTPIPEAEKMKRQWGERDPQQPASAMLEIPGVGERPARMVSYATLSEIIDARARELVELLQAELARSGFDKQLGRGLVLVGGGAKLGGLAALAEQTMQLPIRIGAPSGLEKMGEILPDPAFATVAGLVASGNHQRLLHGAREGGWATRLFGIFGGGKD